MAVSAVIQPKTERANRGYVRGQPRPAPGTLTQLFFRAIEQHRNSGLPCLQYKADGRWHDISYEQLATRVRHVSLALSDLGITRGDRVALLSENRPEWAIVDYACLCVGAADVPVYPTLPAEQMVHILNNSGAKVIFVSTATQWEKIAKIRADVPALQTVIRLDNAKGTDVAMEELERRGAALDTPERQAAWKAAAEQVQPGDLATLIYTSGTTGLPKGVMLTHDNLHACTMASLKVLEPVRGDSCLSFLPLSHIFERMTGHYLMLAGGVTIAYAESIDAVAANLMEVRPTLLVSVPRIYEKMYARIMENGNAATGLKRAIFQWALRTADEWATQKLAKREIGGFLGWKYGLATELVFSKIKERTGGRLRLAVSGGAPLAASINRFFYATGLILVEGYGLTETSPVITVNRPRNLRIGTVGEVVDGVEVLIAEDGEVLTRGPHVMQGYYLNPDATREAIEPDGWFHTGDIGELTDGFLRITDRKKDIIVTAGGKNIAPQPIELRVVTNKYVAQAVMLGDKRKFPIMLVVPDWEQLEKWCGYKNISIDNRAAVLLNELVIAKMNKEVRGTFDGLASFETPKKLALLEHEFSIARGEMTPKLSIKRKVVMDRYRELIDSLYADEHTGEYAAP
jgi:long-chain acyl-CoA synthetase